MHGVGKWTPVPPPEPFQVGHRLVRTDVPDAQPPNQPYRGAYPNQLGEHLLVVEAHPTNAESFRCSREPQVLHGEHGGEQPGIGHGVPAQHVGSAASLVVGNHDPETALADAFHLDRVEGGRPLRRQAGGELRPLVGNMGREPLQGVRRLHQDEVPRLSHPHAGRRMCGGQYPLQNALRDRRPGEFRPDIAPHPNRVIEAGGRLGIVAGHVNNASVGGCPPPRLNPLRLNPLHRCPAA